MMTGEEMHNKKLSHLQRFLIPWIGQLSIQCQTTGAGEVEQIRC